jgi:hypothetical protein
MDNGVSEQQQAPLDLTALVEPTPDHGEHSDGGHGRLDWRERPAEADRRLSQFRCTGCGYGACCRIAPERCPMCGGSTWEHAGPQSFSDREKGQTTRT